MSLMTAANMVSPWSVNTLEQVAVQVRLLDLGVKVVTARAAAGFDGRTLTTRCVYGGAEGALACATLVVVGARRPDDGLYRDLLARAGDWEAAGVKSVDRIGDCQVPGIIAQAVFSGHRYARDLDVPEAGDLPFRLERARIDSD